jgi:hypothetical protein
MGLKDEKLILQDIQSMSDSSGHVTAVTLFICCISSGQHAVQGRLADSFKLFK